MIYVQRWKKKQDWKAPFHKAAFHQEGTRKSTSGQRGKIGPHGKKGKTQEKAKGKAQGKVEEVVWTCPPEGPMGIARIPGAGPCIHKCEWILMLTASLKSAWQ